MFTCMFIIKITMVILISPAAFLAYLIEHTLPPPPSLLPLLPHHQSFNLLSTHFFSTHPPGIHFKGLQRSPRSEGSSPRSEGSSPRSKERSPRSEGHSRSKEPSSPRQGDKEPNTRHKDRAPRDQGIKDINRQTAPRIPKLRIDKSRIGMGQEPRAPRNQGIEAERAALKDLARTSTNPY
ncbi:hypothetical protein F5B20DRAFT_91734 [Whalleya microplaca]|nr:hypothetical protein F5B20DRAFT_91734 [Whalleya microplaca]